MFESASAGTGTTSAQPSIVVDISKTNNIVDIMDDDSDVEFVDVKPATSTDCSHVLQPCPAENILSCSWNVGCACCAAAMISVLCCDVLPCLHKLLVRRLRNNVRR